LFFTSGFPALLYQIIWQRALFTIYGVNIESVTIIVAAFMLGLGLGSLSGGWLSKTQAMPLLGLFGCIELGIGVFGLLSLGIFHRAAAITAGSGVLMTGMLAFALLLIPTVFMGSTLPLLVAHLVRINGNVGESVGSLYSVNTFGSATACFLAAKLLMGQLGQSGCVRLAAGINLCVALAALSLCLVRHHRAVYTPPLRVARNNPLSFRSGLILSGAVGFIALGYELIWYRLYSFATGGTASCFALVLAWYLSGVAYGSLKVRDFCHGKSADSRLIHMTGTVIFWGSIVAFLVGPAAAEVAGTIPSELAYLFVFAGAGLLGAAFPLISHASINPEASDSGARLSYLYLSNILGCTAGSLLVGFILMDLVSLRVIVSLLLAGGMALALIVTRASGLTRRSVPALACGLGITALAWPSYGHLYERLLRATYPELHPTLAHVVETRSGVIAVDDRAIVYGGGIYDGRFNVDLVHDSNHLFRAFAIDAIHADPKDVLIIGLSSGSWAQVIASNPRVQSVTIVEINPGYLQLIPQYPMVASLLRNPKVHIEIDDGRRWLIRNSARFDVIVMNTSFHWRAHMTNILSREFLQLIRAHLKPGGIHYYNTTFSSDALLTGCSVFPHALRIFNCLAVSDSPITVSPERWRESLLRYRIDGHPVLSGNAERLASLLRLAGSVGDPDQREPMRLETRDSLRSRLKGRIITDDNMAAEWSNEPEAWSLKPKANPLPPTVPLTAK
jgi:predicted membrane-bound spermidine synthase